MGAGEITEKQDESRHSSWMNPEELAVLSGAASVGLFAPASSCTKLCSGCDILITPGDIVAVGKLATYFSA